MTKLQFEFVAGSVNQAKPLVYLWEVLDRDGQPIYWYIGKAKNGAGRPLKHYPRNVRNLLLQRPYRKGKPEGFRHVHRQLAYAMGSQNAMQPQYRVVLSLIRNIMPNEDINQVEREEQERRCSR